MKKKCKSCGSCGMPLEKKEDFGGGDITNPYCVHCTDGTGQLTATFDSVVNYYTNDFMDRQGVDKIAAKEMAVKMVAQFPAWQK